MRPGAGPRVGGHDHPAEEDGHDAREAEQRDLYDRPPSVMKDWNDGHVTLLGDSVHAMMPNLGQGGCQATEDGYRLIEELSQVKHTKDIEIV